MDTCNCKSKATISTIGGVEKLHSSQSLCRKVALFLHNGRELNHITKSL